MKLHPRQLPTQLQKKILPIYFISGDEPLLVEESCQAIRGAATKAGYTDRQLFHAEVSFDWNHFLMQARNLSLFSTHVLLDLRLGNGKLNEQGKKALQSYAEKPSSNKILLICSPKLETRTYKTKWLQAIDRQGAIIQIWPIDRNHLPAWTKQRLQLAGLQVDAESLQLLVEQSEGNLLALTQNIEKLRLLYPSSNRLTATEIAGAIADSARYNIFDLADATLLGDAKRIMRILNGLKSEGTEPILILWALSKEIRTLLTIASAIEQGATTAQALSQSGVWEKRKALFSSALKKSSPAQWHNLLIHASEIDRILKGLEKGNVWDELTVLALGVTMGLIVARV